MIVLQEAQANNFKGLESIEVSFGDDRIFYIVGKNGTGKSTLLQSIVVLLEGVAGLGMKKKDQQQLIGNYGNAATTNGIISAHGIKYKISRKITKTTESLEITREDGGEVPENFLENILSKHAYDVKSFIHQTPKEQAKMLGIDTAEIDRKIADAKAGLAVYNKAKLQAGATLKGKEEPEKVERVDVGKLYAEKEEAEKFNRDQDSASKAIDKKIAEVASLTTQLQKAEEALIILPKGQTKKDTAPIQEKIDKAAGTNEEAEKYDSFKIEKGRLKAAKDNWKKQSDKVKDLEVKRIEQIDKQKPYPNIVITDKGELMVKRPGKQPAPLDEHNFNTARLVEMALKLLSKDKEAKMPLFLIPSGRELDVEDDGTIPALEKLAKKGKYQFIVEYVGKTKPTGINSILLKQDVGKEI